MKNEMKSVCKLKCLYRRQNLNRILSYSKSSVEQEICKIEMGYGFRITPNDTLRPKKIMAIPNASISIMYLASVFLIIITVTNCFGSCNYLFSNE